MLDESKILSILGQHLVCDAYGRGRKWFTHVKNGPTWFTKKGDVLIIDGMTVECSWSKPEIVGYEVKTSRSDFTGDTKWMGYIQTGMVHRLYFAAPKGLIKKEELPDKIGLVEVSEDGKIRIRKSSLVCNTEIDPLMFQYIVYSKLDNSSCPVHERTKRIRHYQDAVENSKKGKEVAYALKKEMSRRAKDIEKREQAMEEREERMKEMGALDEYVTELLITSGVRDWYAKDRKQGDLDALKKLVKQKTVMGKWEEQIQQIENMQTQLQLSLSRDIAQYFRAGNELKELLKGVA